MKKIFYPLAGLALIVTSAFTMIAAQDWKIADSYTVKFESGDPTGEFRGLKGTLKFDPADLAGSKFETSIEVASINTGNGMMNTHAKSAQWFDAEKYPAIKFTSSAITKTANGYEAKGILDMHGVQKEITLPFTFDNNTFTGSFEVNRLDFNINTAEPQRGAAKFKINLTVPVTK